MHEHTGENGHHICQGHPVGEMRRDHGVLGDDRFLGLRGGQRHDQVDDDIYGDEHIIYYRGFPGGYFIFHRYHLALLINLTVSLPWMNCRHHRMKTSRLLSTKSLVDYDPSIPTLGVAVMNLKCYKSVILARTYLLQLTG